MHNTITEPAVIHVVGNRPQFVKLTVLYAAIAEQTTLRQMIIHTGQHSSANMSDVFFKTLRIPEPEFQLSGNEAAPDLFTGTTASKICAILDKKKSNTFVIAYGDTNSTLAAALAAARSRKTLLHFESGVRTFDNNMPEEINRVLTDRLSSVHYCCTELNMQNLVNEGFGKAIPAEMINTGDLMLDAFLKIEEKKSAQVPDKNYIACTIHRAANITDSKNLTQIVNALNSIHSDMNVVVPLHPHTARRLNEFSLRLKCTVVNPLTYHEMKHFIKNSDYVITDSGGACREAFFANKKSLIIMDAPFWPEIINDGAALNCAPDKENISSKFQQLPSLNPEFNVNIFGDGNAAVKIARHLSSLAK